LVQVAASTARLHEEQLTKEKLEAIKMYEAEKQERIRLEQLLRGERHSRGVYLKRLRKERKQAAEMKARMIALTEQVRKQKLVNGSMSDTSQLKNVTKSSLAVNSHSISSTDASSLFYRPNLATSFGATKSPKDSADRRQSTSSDGQHEHGIVNRISPILTTQNNGGPSSGDETITAVGDSADGYGLSKNGRGRAATLFVKHELSS